MPWIWIKQPPRGPWEIRGIAGWSLGPERHLQSTQISCGACRESRKELKVDHMQRAAVTPHNFIGCRYYHYIHFTDDTEAQKS